MSKPLGHPSLIHEVDQGSDEWLRLRMGKVTGSRMKDVIAWTYPKPTKVNPEPDPKEAAARIMYRKEMVSERLVGELGKKEVFVSAAMKWGSMNEDVARQNYELRNRTRVRQVGIIDHPTLKVGYSPDGLVGDEGMIEIKCLEPYNHLYEVIKPAATSEDLTMPEQFKPQVQMGLWITDRQWCDFIGYDSRMPLGLDLFVVRIERDNDYINYLADQTAQFLKEVDHEVNFFLKYLPVCRRICRACGAVFIDKVAICPECMQNNSKVDEILEKSEFELLRESVAAMQ